MNKFVLIFSLLYIGNISCGLLKFANCGQNKNVNSQIKNCIFNKTLWIEDKIIIQPNKTWELSELKDVNKTIYFYHYFNLKFIILRQSGEIFNSEIDLHNDCTIDQYNGIILNHAEFEEVVEKSIANILTADIMKPLLLQFNLNITRTINSLYLRRMYFIFLLKYSCNKDGKNIKSLLFNLNRDEFHKFISYVNDIEYWFNKK